MIFFLDECMNVKVDATLHDWFKNDQFIRSGKYPIPYGLDDISLVRRLGKMKVDAVITCDIKQMRSPDRTKERDEYRSQHIHWVGLPHSLVKGATQPYLEAANLLSAMHFIKTQLKNASKPLAIELKRGHRKYDDPVSSTFDI
ncbi:hypothetical protein [Corynebacterium sp. 20_84]